VEVVLDQINRLRDDVNRRDEELKKDRRQLQKLEEVLKALETFSSFNRSLPICKLLFIDRSKHFY